MAGSSDGIIPPVNVRRHHKAMQAAGMKVSTGCVLGVSEVCKLGNLGVCMGVGDGDPTYRGEVELGE